MYWSAHSFLLTLNVDLFIWKDYLKHFTSIISSFSHWFAYSFYGSAQSGKENNFESGNSSFFNDKTESKSNLSKGDSWCLIRNTAHENKPRMSSPPLSSHFRCTLRGKSLNFFSSNHQEAIGKTWNFWRQKCSISSAWRWGEEHSRVKDGFSAPDRYDLYGGVSSIGWNAKYPLEPIWASNRF